MLSSVLPKTNCNIPMPQTNKYIRNCEHCSKLNVCKYKERVEAVINEIVQLHDEKYFDLPLVIDVKCKEYSIGWIYRNKINEVINEEKR